ncbi:MAG: ABC transporter permease subunit [Deltaproteobacteria bacterium]|nr:ABC transporter permease subunit [Deltaproteobacteria bacterium]
MLKAILPYLVSFLLWAGVVECANLVYGPALAPNPLVVLKSLGSIIADGTLVSQLGLTVKRALYGVLLANLLGVLLGLAAGRLQFLLEYTAPLIAGIQSCPPIIWISIAMVFAGTGSVVPVATVFLTTLPFVFSNTAQGAMGLSTRVIAMSALYKVPLLRRLKDFYLPGILPFYLAGLSTVLSTAWKAAAVAEFMGSHDGAGARIYWCYNKLNFDELQAWALSIIILGLSLEALVITPLRKRAASLAKRAE